jgi:hypothetical protein
MSNQTSIKTFGEDDFVFVDRNFNPYFVHNFKPDTDPEEWWLCYWHAPQKAWVTLRKIIEEEREAFRRRSFSREHAEIYF